MTKKQNDAKIAWERRWKAKLLPCAHCGGKAIIVQWRDTKNPNATWVACQNPACRVMTDSQHGTRDGAARAAVKIWNRRSQRTEYAMAMLNKALNHARAFILTQNIAIRQLKAKLRASKRPGA